MQLPESLQAWNSTEFADTFKQEIQSLDRSLLPLQQGLSQSSYVSDSPISVILLDAREEPQFLRIKAGIMYAGIIAGSCCADDPTPVCEENEYCVMEFIIDRQTAQATVRPVSD